jgi:predicted permease
LNFIGINVGLLIFNYPFGTKINFTALINFILIALCIIAGCGLRRLRILPEDAHRGINVWIIYLAVPAISLKYIPAITWSPDLLLPALMPLIVWTGSWLTFKLYSLRWPLDPATRAALTLTAGLGNTSFIGFPLIQGYYGEQALPIAVISDQVSFVIMSTLGAMMAMSTAKSEPLRASVVVKKLILFPPFLAFCAAVILPQFIDLGPAIPLFDRIASTLVPLALFSVGMQLNFSGWRQQLPYLSVGLVYKLIIAPALILLVIVAMHLRGIIPQISLFEAAMAPMITAGVIATQYGLNPRLANLMVGIGILISFISTAIWWWFIQGFG